jgi:hypothetical protein
VFTAADLERAHRYLSEGERHITDLEVNIDRLKGQGAPSEEAERTLAMMREILWLLREYAGDIAIQLALVQQNQTDVLARNEWADPEQE